MNKQYVVQFSGGIGSYCAAKRTIAEFGTENTTLLFADTGIEDADLYRFLNEASLFLQIPVTRISEGKTPWQVFHEKRFLGNSRVDPCSRVLKREPLRKYISSHYTPEDTVICLGIDWSEINRFARAIPR